MHWGFGEWEVKCSSSAKVSMLTVYCAHDDEGAIPCAIATASNDALSMIGCLWEGGQLTAEEGASYSRELEYAMAACSEEYGPETAWSQAH